MKRGIVWLMVLVIGGALLGGCGDDEDAVYFYTRFEINGVAYSFEQGISGDSLHGGGDLTGDPASFNFDSPGMLAAYIYATKEQLPANDLSGKDAGYLKLTVNENCTNTNTYNNVSFRFKHPDYEGIYYENGQSITITEFGEKGEGVMAGTFDSITLTNQTRLDELMLKGGTFRVRLLTNNVGTLDLSGL